MPNLKVVCRECPETGVHRIIRPRAHGPIQRCLRPRAGTQTHRLSSASALGYARASSESSRLFWPSGRALGSATPPPSFATRCARRGPRGKYLKARRERDGGRTTCKGESVGSTLESPSVSFFSNKTVRAKRGHRRRWGLEGMLPENAMECALSRSSASPTDDIS